MNIVENNTTQNVNSLLILLPFIILFIFKRISIPTEQKYNILLF